jgi:hypothetical protein
MPDRSVGNQEYDGVLAFSARAFAGDPRALAQARAAADHALGRDWDALGSGLQFPHGRDHRTGPVEAGHHWIEGLHLLVLWEQDPLLQEQLVRLVASQQAWFAARDLGRELPRSLAWGLLALSAAVPLSATPEQARGELRRWRRHVLGRQGAEGFLHLSRGAGDDLWRVHPFVQGGILLRALVASRGAAPGAGVRAAVQALARALVREALVEDEQGRTRVARSLVVEARSGSVVSHQGLLAGEEAALVLAGLLLADRNLAGHGGLGALRADLPSTLRLSERRRVGQDLVLLLRALAGLDASGAR